MNEALPALRENRSLSQPAFRSLADYCRQRGLRQWPACPQARAPPLARSQLFFAVLTTTRLVQPRGAVMARILRRQNASFAVYADAANAQGVRALPVSGFLERLVHNRSVPTAKGVTFIAQKHLELLHTLAHDSAAWPQSRGARGRPRWWIILDDDSFIFVDRIMQVLSLLDDAEPMLVGGALARSHLCGNGLCSYRDFTHRFGFPPVVPALAGGVSYALSDSGLRRIGRAIEERACLDATLGDVATAACARIAGVRLALLPGGWLVNDASIAANMQRRERERSGRSRDMAVLKHEAIRAASFTGQLISAHKLPDRQSLCWAEHGECDPRCDCVCTCTAGTLRTFGPEANARDTPVSSAALKGRVLSSLRTCSEPPGSTCDFQCPPDTWDDLVRPPADPTEGRADVDGISALASDGVRICSRRKSKAG